ISLRMDTWHCITPTTQNLSVLGTQSPPKALGLSRQAIKGPDGTGGIPQGAVTSLLGAGEWLKFNSEAIYGTKTSGILSRRKY
ncbi:MAG TPA: hypothetical protein DCR55_08770, partial [Lentisphaeria bacterium]|nr:hypothetical protein [Lentisphaeria bacterium]